MAASLGNAAPKVLDASTAHRVDPDWVYGFAEMLPDQADKIARAKNVANPGCYPTGAIALLRPPADGDFAWYPVSTDVNRVANDNAQLILPIAPDAIDAPRLLYGRTWGAPSLSVKVEDRFDPACIAALGRLGELARQPPAHLVTELVDPLGDQRAVVLVVTVEMGIRHSAPPRLQSPRR